MLNWLFGGKNAVKNLTVHRSIKSLQQSFTVIMRETLCVLVDELRCAQRQANMIYITVSF